MKTALTFFIIFLFFLLVLSFWGFYAAIRPTKFVSNITPSFPYEKISFRTKDNLMLHGWWIPSTKAKAKTIILLHGYPADKSNILPAMIHLHADYNLLLFDFRYFGESEGLYSTIGKNEVNDLLAAIQFLKTRGINEVGIWGFSLGGAVALMTAPHAPEIKVIVAESAYARLDWLVYDYYPLPLLRYPLGALTRLWASVFLKYDFKQVSPLTAVSKLRIPILIIHSKEDHVIPFYHALSLQKALRNDPKAKFMFIDEGQHGELMQNHDQIVKTFFDQNLRN